jgi:hydroxymethylglutaryl-CoA lyase
VPTAAKLWVLEELILAGVKHLEVTNFGNPKGMPQFKDADDLFKLIRRSKKVKDVIDTVSLTAITIRERAIDRAIQAKKDGYGPDRI